MQTSDKLKACYCAPSVTRAEAGSATKSSYPGHDMVHMREVFTVYLKRIRAQTAAAGGFLESQIRDIQLQLLGIMAWDSKLACPHHAGEQN